MKEFGIDNSWCQFCHNVWSRQERFVSWNGSIHSCPLRTCQAIPQGDPWGPVCYDALGHLCLLSYRKKSSHSCPPAETVIFMDDRTLIAMDVEGLISRFDAWTNWSNSAGLIENKNKAKVLGSTNRRQKILQGSRLSDIYTQDMCSLGSCTNSSRRSQTAEENHRLNEAIRTVGLISSIGLSFQQFHEAVGAFASSKAAYGWFTRVPTTKGSTDRFWSTL